MSRSEKSSNRKNWNSRSGISKTVTASVVVVIVIAAVVLVLLTMQTPLSMVVTTTTETTTIAPPQERLLRVSFANVPYMDPAVGSDEASSVYFVNVYDTLVYPTKEGNVKPHVAERWDVSSDGMTWTFYLRKGVESSIVVES